MTDTQETGQTGWLRRNYGRLALGAFVIAIIGVALEMSSGFGYRLGILPLQTALLRVLPWGAYIAAAGAVLCLIALIAAFALFKGAFLRPAALVIVGLIVGIGGAYVPYSFRYSGTPRPPIHDISTDLENPPIFVDALPLRAQTGATNTADYLQENKRGDFVINVPKAQMEAYPDIQPVMLEGVAPAEGFKRALDAVNREGWTLITAKPEEGRIEAWDRTMWFGFIDDVVIRVTPVDDDTKIDVRSVSRVGGGDAGKNAQRIRGYVRTLQSMGG